MFQHAVWNVRCTSCCSARALECLHLLMENLHFSLMMPPSAAETMFSLQHLQARLSRALKYKRHLVLRWIQILKTDDHLT